MNESLAVAMMVVVAIAVLLWIFWRNEVAEHQKTISNRQYWYDKYKELDKKLLEQCAELGERADTNKELGDAVVRVQGKLARIRKILEEPCSDSSASSSHCASLP